MKKLKPRFWSGLKSHNNNTLTKKRRDQERESNQDPNIKAKLRKKAAEKREARKLKNIELLSRMG